MYSTGFLCSFMDADAGLHTVDCVREIQHFSLGTWNLSASSSIITWNANMVLLVWSEQQGSNKMVFGHFCSWVGTCVSGVEESTCVYRVILKMARYCFNYFLTPAWVFFSGLFQMLNVPCRYCAISNKYWNNSNGFGVLSSVAHETQQVQC